jgi:dihydroorotate dehydrogenase (fumarate)
MVDLSTTWLGLALRSPLVVGASPLCDDVAMAVRLVEAGAGALVLRSLFEEQIVGEQLAAHAFFDTHVDTDAEARSFLPETDVFALGGEPLLRQLRRLRDAVDVPVIASLNGTTPGGWTSFAREMEAAGAAAIECNLYEVTTDPSVSGADVEAAQVEVVREVAAAVSIPVSVKLSPFYSSVPNVVSRLAEVGARGVVLFNRYYQPDIDLETLDVDRHLVLSTHAELPLRLNALAILHGRTPLSLASSGGVHTGTDAAKAILCGADVVQTVSAILHGGPEALARMQRELVAWLDEQGYRDLDEACGATALDNVADPHAWERHNYTRMLQGWRAHLR